MKKLGIYHAYSLGAATLKLFQFLEGKTGYFRVENGRKKFFGHNF